MKQPFSRLLGLLTSVVALGLTTPAAAQVASELPTDSSAVFRTIVPHRNVLPTPKSVLEVPDEDGAIFPGFSGSP
jgi:hypothetical protein